MANEEKVRIWFAEEEFEDEHGRFERIPEAERLHPNQQLCGYLKVESLMKPPQTFSIFGTNADEVFFCGIGSLKKTIRKSDILYLIRCGISYDSNRSCLSHFI